MLPANTRRDNNLDDRYMVLPQTVAYMPFEVRGGLGCFSTGRTSMSVDAAFSGTLAHAPLTDCAKTSSDYLFAKVAPGQRSEVLAEARVGSI